MLPLEVFVLQWQISRNDLTYYHPHSLYTTQLSYPGHAYVLARWISIGSHRAPQIEITCPIAGKDWIVEASRDVQRTWITLSLIVSTA